MKKNNPGCDCCDDCTCHPELWDWEVVIAGSNCAFLNGTYNFAAASFTSQDIGEACFLWRSSYSILAGLYTARLSLTPSGANGYQAQFGIHPIPPDSPDTAHLGAFIAMDDFPQLCEQATAEVSGLGGICGVTGTATFTAT